MGGKERLYAETKVRAAGLTEGILQAAIERQASDVHFQWISGGVMVRFRESGLLEDYELLSDEIGRKVVSHLKVLGGMNIADRRRPQDGRMFYHFAERDIDFRLATIPTLYGENLTMRVFDRATSMRSLDDLGLEPNERRRFEDLIRAPHGLILVTGPTGAGKTSTLYAALRKLNDPCRNIITVEDPVEYDIDRVNQIGVQKRAGVGFNECMRAAFRHDPDVIMIGEIRDSESARIAVRAALSGHLVLSTLHTESAVGTFTTLVQLGVSPFLASSALLGVVTQQLVRRICPDCRETFDFPVETLGAVERREFEEAVAVEGNPSFAIGTGCDHCRGTGFRGRTGLFEILEVNNEIREGLATGISRQRLESLARLGGWRSLQLAGFCKIARGETTIEEVLRVVPVQEHYEDDGAGEVSPLVAL